MAIERRAGLSYAEFRREYLLPRRPVILTDALRGMPACSRWTPSYLAERLGRRPIYTDDGWVDAESFLQAIADSGAAEGRIPFLRERPLPWMLPELIEDLQPYPVYAGPNWLEYPFARWADPFRRGFGAMLSRLSQMDINVTGAGVRFPLLHLDRYGVHALIMQWYGEKEVFVFDPEQTPFLYVDDSGEASAVRDMENPDLQRFPLFAQARMQRVRLRPGEALFNPSGWWHSTVTRDVSIATVISFANDSNWLRVVRGMWPSKPLAALAFVPFGLYLLWLGWFRLPQYKFPDASTPAAAQRSQALFEKLRGPWFPAAW